MTTEEARDLARSGESIVGSGVIHAINVSAGGVPKRPVASAEVGSLGIVGDRQRDLRHHGGPSRALCLYALEAIEALKAEGHPIYPGAAGENLTIVGIDWRLVTPGLFLTLGAAVTLKVEDYAPPCQQIAPCFYDHGYKRISHKVNLGMSRVYASVVSGGTLGVGDAVRLLRALPAP